MADGFWKALGSKLVETGAAYAQQVRLVNELKQLSPEEARARFTKYVQGLSSTARAGLSMTLALLENNERGAEAKRFIESLRTALTNPKAAFPAMPTASAPPAPASPRAPASFDDDLNRASAWCDLPDDQRGEAVIAYLDRLDVEGLKSLQANLETMHGNGLQNTQAHRENEARIVAGRFIEDQMNYRLSVRATNQHDPGWQRQLHELERYTRLFEALHEVVGLAIKQHLEPPAPPPAPERSDRLRELDALKQMLEEQLRSGEVRGERGVALGQTLEKLEAVLAAADRGEIGPEQAGHRVRQLFADAAPFFADPGAKTRVAGGSPRLSEVDAYVGEIKAAIARELMEPLPAATAEALGAVLGDLSKFQQMVADADDAALAQLESTLLRPAARARHELAMARHALIARPLWESVEHMPQVNAIAYAGGHDLQRELETALAPRQLTVLSARQLQNHGQSRWDDLNRCHVAVFDLRGASRIAALAAATPKRARELTAAAYELGLAFALGKPLVLICDADEAMPFDIDLAPLALGGGADDATRLQQAVDAAFYRAQRSDRQSSIAESVALLDRLTAGHPKRKSFERMGWLDPAQASDPAGFVARAEQLIPALPAPPWRLLRPAWPAAYPDEGQRRCFHVMPFGPDWADETRDVARATCKEQGFVYRRGDEAEEGRIIHAIWDDLCRASVVLIDLTGPNLNVLIELGIAHAIGRPVIAVQRRDPDRVNVRPKHIEKLRVHSYSSPTELKKLLLARLPA
jgi:nucleoside 2-deoxyribosyltransferase